ncbi:MAG: Ig-like domain-containing protein, partial [Eubacteriales bacterium]|nr:Ig-like domain-containing protein [Eubacteriales bacterium]
VTPLVVAPATVPKTLFQFGTDTFNWTNANLSVKLYDDTAANIGGTTLTMGTAIAAGTYVLYINGVIFNPATPYNFLSTDIGSKTLTVMYTYKPTGNTHAVTVTKDVTISVQRHILQSIDVTGPAQLSYYAGEYLNLSGLVVKATYSNMTDPVTLDSSKYTLRVYKDTEGTDEITTADALTTQNTLKVSVTEAYAGTETTVTATKTATLVVSPSVSSLSIAPATSNMTLGVTAPITITATVGGGDTFASLVASVDKPAIAAIDTSTLTADGKVVVTALSVGTAIVTIRARGTGYTHTASITVEKAPTPVSSLALDRTALSLPVNGTYTLTATIGPDNATDKTVKWEVEAGKESDVSVDSTGTVKVLRNFTGTVTVTATSNDTPTATQNCLISVNTILVDGISISDTSATIYKGSWKQLSAVITPSGAADPAITWTSSNTAVATVDSTGKVTAVSVPAGATYGEAIITAQSSNPSVFSTCTIRVLQSVLITSLTLNKSDLALNVGDEETLTVTGTPTNATNKVLQWTSSNPEVASVSAGKVIAASKGSAVIRADATDGSGKFVSCVVTVSNIQILNVYLDKSSLDLSEGDTASVVATVFPTNATTRTLKWTSSNTSVATVDSKGNVIAGATKGYAIITATATDGSGKFAECVVLSKPKVHVTGITINYGTTLDLLVNDSTYLKATILPANASAQSVTWASSNTAIASIDASTGLLKGIALGEATITATAGGKSVSIKVNVTNTEFNHGVAANFKRRVNVRASASGLSKAVGFAYLGDTFKILGRTGSWYLIQYNNTTKAYIWASYINATKTAAAYISAGSATGTGATTSPGVVTNPTKVTIANCLYSVNVRQTASTTSTRIGKANLGATFTYLGKEGDWYKIQYNTTTVGYVYGTFVIPS